MSEPATAALYRALAQRLQNSGDVWGGRVYAENAPATITRPYVIFQYQGGGERNRLLKKQDANLVVMVKIVADTMANAFAGAGRLSELLNDMGYHDHLGDPTRALQGGNFWHILTTSQEATVHLSELVDGVQIFHEGFSLRVLMEAK